MNRSRLLILTIAAVVSLATWIFRDATLAQEKGTAGATWEYKIMDSGDLAKIAAPDNFKVQSAYDKEEEEKGLNKLATETWEMVAVAPSPPYTYRYVFKRPKAAK
jgi:hypothetical protein